MNAPLLTINPLGRRSAYRPKLTKVLEIHVLRSWGRLLVSVLGCMSVSSALQMSCRSWSAENMRTAPASLIAYSFDGKFCKERREGNLMEMYTVYQPKTHKTWHFTSIPGIMSIIDPAIPTFKNGDLNSQLQILPRCWMSKPESCHSISKPA